MLSTCLARLPSPRSTAAGSGVARASLATPPCSLRARTVATRTTTAVSRPADTHLMSKNFSAPRSKPNPASVTAQSAWASAILVAITELQPWAMLAKGPPWTKRRHALDGLHQVGQDRVLEQDHHRAHRLEVGRGDRLPREGQRDDDALEPASQVLGVLGEAERGHDLRGRGDVEAGLPRHPVDRAAEADDDVAQRAVVHVDDAPPEDAPRVDVQSVALVDVVVEHRGEQVVGRRDGVEVAGEVEVDVGLGHDARRTAAGGAALHAEGRTERRLAQRQADRLADLGQPLREADRGRGLALAGVGRGDRRDQHQPAGRRLVGPRLERDLGLVVAVELEVVAADSEPSRNLGDRLNAGNVAHRTLLWYCTGRSGADAREPSPVQDIGHALGVRSARRGGARPPGRRHRRAPGAGCGAGGSTRTCCSPRPPAATTSDGRPL